MDSADVRRQFLRHALATLAYRAGKVVRGVPESFAAFDAYEKGKTSLQVLSHMSDLMDWALRAARNDHTWRDSKPLSWSEEANRFFNAVQDFDHYLASSAPLAFPEEKLFQGPIADALTHTGQLAMLRRLAGCPMKGENYSQAEITAGRVGLEQTPPTREF